MHKELRSNFIKALFTGSQPRAGFNPLNPSILISILTSIVGGLYKTYIKLLSGTCKSEYRLNDTKISPAEVSSSIPIGIHSGIGAKLSKLALDKSTTQTPIRSSEVKVS
jgi:hypothetical protein